MFNPAGRALGFRGFLANPELPPMRLTLHSDYSLRVLLALGVAEGRRGTIGAIAAQYGISRNHLMKVCHRLQQLGYIETVRGKNGGLRLARDPATIRVGDVVRDMEPDLELVECFSDANRCVITRACRLQHVLADGLKQFFDSLNRNTLADLLEVGPPLSAALGAARAEGAARVAIPVRRAPRAS
jgi:Rrf2 family transcriptional regulator, nitric oxide-sensitive transcriptional repressor